MKCWFPGGSSAPVLLDEHLDLPYTFEAMAEAGSMLGSGAIIVVDSTQPIVPLALRLAEFYRHESCGKCVPCREGTNWTVKMLERIDEGEGTPMDIEIMAEVQENIIGNCLCVLGDSMAMPIGSMIKHFREEFEEHIERARERADREALAPADGAAPSCRSRVTFEIDGREVTRARGHDARRRRQARRRRDPLLLLRAQARAAGGRVPHVPGGDRGHAQAPDLLLHAGEGRAWW